MVGTVHQKLCGSEFGPAIPEDTRRSVLHGVVSGYYSPGGKEVILDTNRSWTARLGLLTNLYPNGKVICCVRDLSWILNSIELMLAKNPLHLSRIFNFKGGTSVYSRAEQLMNSETGLIGMAWSGLREAWFGDMAGQMLVVPYDSLVANPIRTLREIYTFIGEPYFEHNPNSVTFDNSEYDAELGMPGLHYVRPIVALTKQKTIIPPDLFSKYSGSSFWNNKELNVRGVQVL
jgi:sulfotransferase